MYRFMRSAQVKAGKLQEGIGWAAEIAGYITANHGLEVQVGVETFGDLGRIYWMSEVESLAQWEDLNFKLLADETFQARLTEVGDFFVDAEAKDTLIMLLPAD